ncbi:two-component regulator propeller domain-containing protein [Dyadobacter sp. LHD-138]|uniref:hybrid sensor histidine kinase/response regulator transcription factor n=1 Tax=Dyadobacter sp. LHD-138 TaxID=3071413 RepID=UPI0027DF977E|nr:two-component regulator propeller domain-containing protein [Dyadobacter sp. LHD-138]MDQ6476884.1 two-component regulator propeller domain-containing protein [Dyadobacter sp. LHD-138]
MPIPQKKVFLTIVILVIFCIGSGSPVNAKDDQPKFTALTSMDGLSSNTVHTILKDRYGLLWFGTDDGLNKYDGTEFTVYRHNQADPASLRSNDISTLHEDKLGQIWIGSVQGSLHLYNRRKDNFIRINANDIVTAITSDHTGKIWVATSSGLLTVNPVTHRITRFNQRPGVAGQIANGQILSLFADSKEQMWIGTETGLYRFDFKTGRFLHLNYEHSTLQANGGSFVKTISGDKLGNIWVGTSNGLHKLTADGNLLQTFRYQVNNEKTISSNMIYAIAAENQQKLWICTDGGLNLMDIRTGNVTRYAPDTRTPFSLTNKSVRSILIDKQGIFWLGTYKGGINKYDRNFTIFGLYRSDPHDPYSLSAPFVTSFAEKKDGDIFVGTDGGGLNLYHRQTNLFTKIPVHPKNKLASPGLAIMSLEMSSPDRLWIGTFQDGLFALNPSNGHYQQFTQGKTASSLNNNDIFCMTTDTQGRLWIGTNGGGVNLFDPRTQHFSRYFDPATPLQKREIPLNGYIRAIHQDKRGKIWIASHGTGLAIYDPERKKSILLDKQSSNLPGNVVLSIHEDRKGNIWIGTGGEGLAMFNEKTRRFSVFAHKEGLPNGVVHKILEDAQGRIWVSTNQGVSYLDPATKSFVNFTQYNGLQNYTFVLGAGIRTRDNLLFFGGIQGFNYLDTGTLRQKNNEMPIILKELRAGNKIITPSDSLIISEHISIAKSIHLEYKQNFSISYAELNYSDPLQTVFRYRLEGLDGEWHQAGFSKTASYTNLSPGTYTFKVQARNYKGIWNEPGTTIKVVVSPPFYMTLYAYLFYFTAFFGLLFLIRHKGIQRLKNKFSQERHDREIERQRELDEMKIKFLTNLSHELRTPISLILAPLDHLLNKSAPIDKAQYVKGIKRNAKRLLNLVDQLLDFKSLQEHELKLDSRRGEIVSFIKETAESFRYLSQTNGIEFIVDSQIESLYMDFDANKIERVILNLLSNAFKHTPKKGRITLSILKSEDTHAQQCLYIQVSDTGIGIPSDKHELIFERFFQHDSPSNVLNQGSGIGLSIVKEFVQLHKGSIIVESEPGHGSVFTVCLPHHSPEAVLTPPPIKPMSVTANDSSESIAGQVSLPTFQGQTNGSADILVIEDNEEFRSYLKENLQTFYRVIEASNGVEGWQKALSQHPEIIISDITMPEMDGILLSQKIKSDKRTAHIPVILLTASTGEEQELRGLNSGANDYLTKPFNFDILKAKINNLLLLSRLLKSTYTRHIDVTRPEPQVLSGNQKLLTNILAYIDKNLDNSPQLGVEKLSKQLGMSRGTLYNKLLEITGQTPVEFIRTVKLEKAAILLEKSDLNVSQISYAAGFATPNYFARSFKAKFNMLPSEYMNAKRKCEPAPGKQLL